MLLECTKSSKGVRRKCTKNKNFARNRRTKVSEWVQHCTTIVRFQIPGRWDEHLPVCITLTVRRSKQKGKQVWLERKVWAFSCYNSAEKATGSGLPRRKIANVRTGNQGVKQTVSTDANHVLSVFLRIA